MTVAESLLPCTCHSGDEPYCPRHTPLPDARVSDRTDIEAMLSILDKLCQDSLDVPLSHTDGLLKDGVLDDYNVSALFHQLKVAIGNSREYALWVEQERENAEMRVTILIGERDYYLESRDTYEAVAARYRDALAKSAGKPCAIFPDPPPTSGPDGALVCPSNCITQKNKTPCHTCLAREALGGGGE